MKLDRSVNGLNRYMSVLDPIRFYAVAFTLSSCLNLLVLPVKPEVAIQEVILPTTELP